MVLRRWSGGFKKGKLRPGVEDLVEIWRLGIGSRAGREREGFSVCFYSSQ